jgi:hypothetical protein
MCTLCFTASVHHSTTAPSPKHWCYVCNMCHTGDTILGCGDSTSRITPCDAAHCGWQGSIQSHSCIRTATAINCPVIKATTITSRRARLGRSLDHSCGLKQTKPTWHTHNHVLSKHLKHHTSWQELTTSKRTAHDVTNPQINGH